MNTGMAYGIDCKRLGRLFASALIYDAKTKVEDFPKLVSHPKYKKLHESDRNAVCMVVRSFAGNMLLAAGHSPDVVKRIMDGNK